MAAAYLPQDVSVIVRVEDEQIEMTVSRMLMDHVLDEVDVPYALKMEALERGQDLEREAMRDKLLPIFYRAAEMAVRRVAEDYVSRLVGLKSRNPYKEP